MQDVQIVCNRHLEIAKSYYNIAPLDYISRIIEVKHDTDNSK